MNPYGRFGLVSNSASAAILVGGLVSFGLPVFDPVHVERREGNRFQARDGVVPRRRTSD